MAVKVANKFGAWDYVVFVSMLVISIGIGVFFAIKGRNRKTQGDFLMASRSMQIIPVAISILVSFMSAILILGTPAEMYTQGTEYFMSTVGCSVGIVLAAFVMIRMLLKLTQRGVEYYLSVVGMTLGIIMAALMFVPLLFPLNITSAFEYLEKRYKSRSARLMGTFLMIGSQILYMGIASFAPSTALEAVTGFPVWATILIIGAVATLYTSIGGMRAVVWTDVFQSLVMISGMLAIVIQGAIKVGSLSRVWEINEKWDRINFFNFDPNPTTRHSVWSLVVGSAMMWVGTYGLNQASVQRYCSLPTLAKARMSVLLNILGVTILLTVTCLSGIVLFAFYADKNCDPLGQKLVDNSNQLIPYFVMETLGYPGVPGLFISSLFSGALSSVSSSLNALAAITWEDIFKPHYDEKMTEVQKTVFTQIMVVVYGCLAIGMSFVAQQLEGTVLQMAVSLIGSVAGPLTGMFVLGAFFPWANSYGAITGAFCGLGMGLWLSVGAYVTGIPTPKFPYPNGTCPVDGNVTLATTTTTIATTVLSTTTGQDDETPLKEFYSISYLWFTSIGILLTVVVGLIISFITGANSMHDVPTKYQIPLFTRLFCCLPKSWQYKLNCCRDFERPEDIRSQEKDREIIIEAPLDESRSTFIEKLGQENLAFKTDLYDSDKVNGTGKGDPPPPYPNGHLDHASVEKGTETSQDDEKEIEQSNGDVIVERF